jgi:galactokinase
VSRRRDAKVNFYSANFPKNGVIELPDITKLKYNKAHGWANYPKGVVVAFQEAGFPIERGFDIVYAGDIPTGAALSSSAAIEVLTGVMMSILYKLAIPSEKIALLAQKAENEFVGMNCGIMDQFASAMGKKDNAILLDCATLDYKYIPLELKDSSLVIINTNKPHELVNSKYNERRAQCETALKDLRTELDIKNLCSLSPDAFEKYKHLIKDPICLKRAKHAVYENVRTLEAAEALRKNDIAQFGKLMIASHNSLRDDYEVSCKELDTAVELALSLPQTVGARMTGGGFGGCAVCIVKNDGVDSFIKEIGPKYENATGLKADFYKANTSDGATRERDPFEEDDF